MNKKIIQGNSNKIKVTTAILAGFFIPAFFIGTQLDIAPLTSIYGYSCFDAIKKFVCNGSDSDCNNMKTKECKKGTLDGTICTQKFVSNDLKVSSD